jgi:hypothetical protein
MDRTTHAIERVLQLELEAEDAIRECERECAELLEAARRKRLDILTRANARISLIRKLGARLLEEAGATTSFHARHAGTRTGPDDADPRMQEALSRLTARLTTLTAPDEDAD